MVTDGEASPLQELLKKHPTIFDGELGSMKDITVKLTVQPGSTPKCLKARQVSEEWGSGTCEHQQMGYTHCARNKKGWYSENLL